MSRSAQWVRLYCLDSPYSVEVVHAHYVEHRFARHAHEHFVVGLIDQGVQQYSYRGSKHTTFAGQVFFVNGSEPHTGESASPGGYIYRTLCLGPGTLTQFMSDIANRRQIPHFRGAVVADRHLFSRLRTFHKAVAEHASSLECESALLTAIRYILATHVEDCRQATKSGKENSAVVRIREYLETHYAEDISLSELSALTSLSPFHIARAFSSAMGLPPHAYLESIRIRHARALLRSGLSVVDTALSVGYSDQSHFTHRFRRHTGITPGHYQQSEEF